MTIRSLSEHGQSNRSIAGLLGVTEGAVRYHRRRQAEDLPDGRTRQLQRASSFAEQIATYIESVADGPVSLAALHDWLLAEHDYEGSLRSVQRYFSRHFPTPRRCRRRVETPPGAQAQVDWSEWPLVHLRGVPTYLYLFHMVLSHSRKAARVWSLRADQIGWHHVHNEAFTRVGGIPAVVRVDNTKTAVSRGAGAWGSINRSYRSYAGIVRFHIDPCAPRSPQHKGKVERDVRTTRMRQDLSRRSWASIDELQEFSDDCLREEEQRRICPATGTSVHEAWQAELSCLQSITDLPEAFDVAVTRTVGRDGTVRFGGRQYSVPFALMGKRIEILGGNHRIHIVHDGEVVARHDRRGRERIVIDTAHYQGPDTDRVLAPVPLGKMGRRLEEIAAMCPQERPLDLYAALAEVAR